MVDARAPIAVAHQKAPAVVAHKAVVVVLVARVTPPIGRFWAQIQFPSLQSLRRKQSGCYVAFGERKFGRPDVYWFACRYHRDFDPSPFVRLLPLDGADPRPFRQPLRGTGELKDLRFSCTINGTEQVSSSSNAQQENRRMQAAHLL